MLFRKCKFGKADTDDCIQVALRKNSFYPWPGGPWDRGRREPKLGPIYLLPYLAAQSGDTEAKEEED